MSSTTIDIACYIGTGFVACLIVLLIAWEARRRIIAEIRYREDYAYHCGAIDQAKNAVKYHPHDWRNR